MIITAIVQAIKSFFAAIGKVIAWLLTALGLWVPLLYSVIFLIVIAIAGIPIETTGTAYFLVCFARIGVMDKYGSVCEEEQNEKGKEGRLQCGRSEKKESKIGSR